MAQATSERTDRPARREAWQAQGPGEVLGALGTDRQTGLTASPVREQPPSRWAVALQQVRDPVNISLIAVAVASATGLLVTSNAILRAR